MRMRWSQGRQDPPRLVVGRWVLPGANDVAYSCGGPRSTAGEGRRAQSVRRALNSGMREPASCARGHQPGGDRPRLRSRRCFFHDELAECCVTPPWRYSQGPLGFFSLPVADTWSDAAPFLRAKWWSIWAASASWQAGWGPCPSLCALQPTEMSGAAPIIPSRLPAVMGGDPHEFVSSEHIGAELGGPDEGAR
jgi:hypothetical protein